MKNPKIKNYLLDSDFNYGKQTVNIINKWDELQFTQFIKNKRNASIAFEFATLYLIDASNREKLVNNLDVITYPIIRKIFEYQIFDVSFSDIIYNTINIIESLDVSYSIYLQDNLIEANYDDDYLFYLSFADNYKFNNYENHDK